MKNEELRMKNNLEVRSKKKTRKKTEKRKNPLIMEKVVCQSAGRPKALFRKHNLIVRLTGTQFLHYCAERFQYYCKTRRRKFIKDNRSQSNIIVCIFLLQ